MTDTLREWKEWIAEQVQKRKQIVEKKNDERRERNAERIKKIENKYKDIDIATGRPSDIYGERKKYWQAVRKYRRDDPRLVEARERYAAITGEMARATYGSTWADEEYAAYLKSYHAHGKESPLTKEAYETWIKAAIKTHRKTTIWETPPPKHPELEETRGPIMSTLLGGESAAGTTIYNLRKRLGFKPIDWIEQTESDEALKEITPSQAFGLTTRETSLLTFRGIAGLGIDIWLDPITHLKPVFKLVGKGLEIVSSTGKKITINEKGIEILERQTKGIREHFGVSADEARKAAENLVVDLTRDRKEILAARKYQEPTFSFMGHPIFYWSDVSVTGKKVWEGAPLYKQRASVAHWLRETFEPYYKVTQAAGKHAGDVFAEQVRKYEYGRSEWSKAARDLSKKYPRWFRKKEIISLDEQASEYIERGITPTDPRAYVIAENMVTAQNVMAEQEIAEGILKREQLRKGYVFHVFTKEFKEEVLAKKYGYKKGEDPLVYLRKLESAHPREMQGSIKQINEWAMEEYGIKALETNLPRILELRGIESVRAVAASELRRRVGIELGVPAEQISPMSSRMHPKYTPAQINEILDKKYGEKIETLRETLGIPEEAEINTAEDVMRYITPEPVAPLAVSFGTPEDVMQYLERGRGVDITDLRAVPAKETKAAAAARKKADQYERRLKPFYRFLEDIKAGKIRPTTVQNVEEAMAAENRGMFVGVRVSGMPVKKFMEPRLETAKEYRRYEDEISELESDIIKYRGVMERTPSMTTEYSDLIAGNEKQIAHSRERQAHLIEQLQEKTSSIKREIVEPSERKIAHQKHIAGMGITAPIEWGAGLPTDISRMPATMSPIDWVIRSTEQSALQKGIDDASETLITTIKKRDIDLKNLQFAKSAPGALPEKVFVNGKWLVRHKYTLTTGETRVSYVDEAVEEELGRSMDVVMSQYDKAMRGVRYGYTMPWPAFHMRNIQGIIWQNLYAGVRAEDYALNWKIMHGNPTELIDVPVYGKISVGELREMYRKAGIYGQTGFVQEPQYMRGAGIIGKTAIETPAYSMVEIENIGRGAVATRRLMRGENIDTAAEWARRLQFEYGAAGTTAREQKYLRRGALFYTWPKKNIALQYRMLMEHPDVMASALKAQQMMITPDEYQMLPPWAKDSYVLVAGGEYYVLDVPFIEGLHPLSTVAFMHSPALKFYTSVVSGHDWETGKKIGVEDIPGLALRSFGGRFRTTYLEMMKQQRGDITTKQLAIHQGLGVYTKSLEDIPLETAYWGMRRWKWQPKREDLIAAFEESGMLAEHYETLWTPPSAPRSEVFTKGKPWWKQPYLFTPPWEWGKFSSKDQYIGEKGIVIGYTQEEWEKIGGHKLTDEQKVEVKKVYELEGAASAARLRVEMAEMYHEAYSMLGGKKPVPSTSIIEAYYELKQAVGLKGAKDWRYKVFYTAEGEPNVMPLTKDEFKEWGTWQPPEELVSWISRKTLTPKDKEYNRMIKSINQIEATRSFAGQLFPFQSIESHEIPKVQQKQIYEHLQKLQKETGFVPSEAQIKWATRSDEGWIALPREKYEREMAQRAQAHLTTEEYRDYVKRGLIAPIHIGFDEQMEIWSEEFEAERKLEEDRREELGGLRADIRGTTKIHKNDPYVSDLLMMTRGGEMIGERMTRKRELEDLLGVGVDR